MTNTPDPNYWGNPPITPTAASGRKPTQNGAAQHGDATPMDTQAGAQAQTAAQGQTPESYPPPSDAPVFQSAQAAPDGQTAANTQQPPAQDTPTKHRETGIVIVVAVIMLLAVSLVVGGCTLVRSLAGQIATGTIEQESTEETVQDESILQDNTEYLNENLRETFGIGSGEGALSESEIASIKSAAFSSQSTRQNADGSYDAGVYYVGSELPAGEYWFYGSDEQVSLYYVLTPTSDGGYNVKFANNYYGHNIMAVEEGQVLIAYNPEGLLPLAQMTETFTSPYTNGVFRVGIDLPAGLYDLSEGQATDADYSAFYVMSDLKYSDSSITDSQYFLPGEDPETTAVLEEGTYVELYNMTLTPAGKTA